MRWHQIYIFRSSSRPDLITITPIYVDRFNDCSHQVVITAASSKHNRWFSWRYSNRWSYIHELAVLTTTRELYIEEVSEKFKMWTFDSQGYMEMVLISILTNWMLQAMHFLEFTWMISSQNHRSVDSKVKNSWQEVYRIKLYFNAIPLYILLNIPYRPRNSLCCHLEEYSSQYIGNWKISCFLALVKNYKFFVATPWKPWFFIVHQSKITRISRKISRFCIIFSISYYWNISCNSEMLFTSISDYNLMLHSNSCH